METSRKRISGVQIGIIILALATAAIHLVMAFAFPDPKFTPLFILNALGYVVLLVAYLLPQLARDWLDFNYLLVNHGRASCRARRPLCPGCPLMRLCPSAGKLAHPRSS